MLAGALVLFIALRIVHGFAFGMVSVAGNTIVIDILPSSRRGEGLHPRCVSRRHLCR